MMYTTKIRRAYPTTMLSEIDALFNELWNPQNVSRPTNGVNYTLPKANVVEYKDRFQLDLTIPGLKREEIHVNVDKNILTIVSEKTVEDERKYALNEFRMGKFTRKFKLPETVNIEMINATLENGILSLSLPKKPEAVDHGPREINIV